MGMPIKSLIEENIRAFRSSLYAHGVILHSEKLDDPDGDDHWKITVYLDGDRKISRDFDIDDEFGAICFLDGVHTGLMLATCEPGDGLLVDMIKLKKSRE